VKDFDIFKFLENDADDEESSGDLSSNEKEDMLDDYGPRIPKEPKTKRDSDK
jgi:hypothetical protein